MTKVMINNRTDALKTDVNLLNRIKNTEPRSSPHFELGGDQWETGPSCAVTAN